MVACCGDLSGKVRGKAFPLAQMDKRLQRGVGWTQVVNPPWMMRYFFGPIFWSSSPQKNASGSWVPNMPGSGASRRIAVPHAL